MADLLTITAVTVRALLATVVWTYSILTLPIYAVKQRIWRVKKKMKEIKTESVYSSDGLCVRKKADLSAIQLEIMKNNLFTVPKLFKHACLKYADKKALGSRDILREFDEKQPDGKVFSKLDLGDYKWISYNEAFSTAKKFGNGLRTLGFAPQKKIVIYADTRQEWFLAAMGCFQQSTTICTLYTTLGIDGLIHGINETEAELIISSFELLPKLQKILENCPKVKSVIYFPSSTSNNNPELSNAISFDEVVQKGSSVPFEECPPSPSDVAFIMYTSGSTGAPKGVMLSHENITTSMMQFSPVIPMDNGDIYLAYLPLAHVLELLGETCMLLFGTPMGYSTPYTLTDIATKIPKGGKGDASILKPTVVPSVPLILDRIYKGSITKATAGGPIIKEIFHFFVNYRIFWMKGGWDTPLSNRFIFKKTRDMLGGRVKSMGCGGAPLSPETHDMIRAILGINVSQGYGLTETCATAAMMDIVTDFSTGRVGPPLYPCDIKLVDWSEGGYSIHDKPNPRGEIIIGGKNIAIGYYKNREETKQNFFEVDGQRWFRTGDIGEFYPDGSIGIIDRKKDLLKLQHGEYVSLGKVESVLKLCSVVDNICIYGSSLKSNVIAIVSLDQQYLKKNNIQSIYENGLHQTVLKLLQASAKTGKLMKHETPVNCHITEEAWTTENGLVTATMKIRRKNIEIKYQNEIKNMVDKLS